jgi:hypothetical protein
MPRWKRPDRPWKYTLGADWSGHSEETRRSVEALLAYLTYEAKDEFVRDYDSPIGRFMLERLNRNQ